MPGNTGGIRRGASRPLHPTGILVSVAVGSAHRGLLRDVVPGFPGGDAGGPSIPNHIQCSGGRSGTELGSGDGRARRWEEQVRTGGMTLKRPLLCG